MDTWSFLMGVGAGAILSLLLIMLTVMATMFSDRHYL